MKRSSNVLLLGAAAVLAFAGPAQAGLIGTTVDITFAGLTFNQSASVPVVTPDAEVACSDPTTCTPANFFGGTGLFDVESINIEDLSIVFNLASGFPDPQAVRFSGPGFSGLQFASLSSQIPWLTAADVVFSGNVLTVDLVTSDQGGGGIATIFFREPQQNAPEPGTLFLLAGGLLALGLRRSRQRR